MQLPIYNSDIDSSGSLKNSQLIHYHSEWVIVMTKEYVLMQRTSNVDITHARPP